MNESFTIERRTAPSRPEFVREYLKPGRPVILTDVVSRWPAVSRWNLDYLASVAGHRSAAVLQRDDFARVAHANEDRRTMTLGAYLEHLRSGSASGEQLYLADVPLAVFPELLPDIGSPPYFVNSERQLESSSRVLFLGQNTYTPPHHHAYCLTVVCQIVGEKRMKIFPPSESARLYPPSLWEWARHGLSPQTSQVDIDAPDLERHPAFRDASYAECVLGPGDMLFMPVHYWHAVYSDALSAAVTFNFPDPDLRHWQFPNPGLLSLAVQAHELTQGLTARLRQRKHASRRRA